MKKSILTTALGAAVLFASPALAGSDGSVVASTGNLNADLLVSNCAVCHGQGGDSNGHIPSIDGLNKAQMVNALMNFKSGDRKGTIMQRIAPGYTDAQIEVIANELTGN